MNQTSTIVKAQDKSTDQTKNKIEKLLTKLERFINIESDLQAQKDNIHFNTLINTDIQKLINNNKLKDEYLRRVNYFENLKDDPKFNALINNILSIKKDLLNSIDTDLANKKIDEMIDPRFVKLENKFKKLLEDQNLYIDENINLVKNKIKNLRLSKNKQDIDYNKTVILDITNIVCFYYLKDKDNKLITEDKQKVLKEYKIFSLFEKHIEYCITQLFLLNKTFTTGGDYDEEAFNIYDLIEYFNNKNNIEYKHDFEKENYITLLKKEKYNHFAHNCIQTEIKEFSYFIKKMDEYNFFIDKEISENLIKKFNEYKEELNNILFKIPQNEHFNYFNNLENYFKIGIRENLIYPASETVLEELLEFLENQDNEPTDTPEKLKEEQELTEKQKKILEHINILKKQGKTILLLQDVIDKAKITTKGKKNKSETLKQITRNAQNFISGLKKIMRDTFPLNEYDKIAEGYPIL